ncbi:hypothetical protein AYK24_01550 [Thermoplasmatales archaeon SG8-52-4]|nr:MAG: hypothetical protein AYK24_01550 [Thermoplasmatales archaeon SG8-52-4]
MVLVIIILFISIGFKPALSNEVSVPTISNSEEDCDCNIPNGKLHLVKNVINKAENYLESSYLFIPNIFPFERPVCKILWDIMYKYAEIASNFLNLSENAPPDSDESIRYYILFLQYIFVVFMIMQVGIWFYCWDNPFPPYPY